MVDTTTLQGAIVQVARNMGLTNQAQLTPYSNDAVIAYLQQAHSLIVGDREWDEMVIWRERTLDGTTGLITQLITDTTDWKRIRRIYHESMQTPLAKISSYTNPLEPTASLVFGYRGLPPEEDNTVNGGRYLVRFHPATLTGQVMFQIDRVIDFDNLNTVLPISWDWHVALASWLWAGDDGTNPAQLDKFAKQVKMYSGNTMARENSRPAWQQPNQLIPNDWWEQDAPYS